MDRNSISLLFICPVLLGIASCREEQPGEFFSDSPPLEGTAERAPAFAVERPDSMVSYLLWSGNSPLIVARVEDSQTVMAGDTAVLGFDPFLEIETDRMRMELEFADATGDSVAADSLRGLLADSSVYLPVVFTQEGRVELRVAPGEEIQPGDTVAAVTAPPADSVFVVLPGAGHLVWPHELDGSRLPSGGILLTGEFPGDSIILPGFYSVASHFVHEAGLSTFLVTSCGDTLHVTVACNANGVRTVYSQVPLDSLVLSSWN